MGSSFFGGLWWLSVMQWLQIGLDPKWQFALGTRFWNWLYYLLTTYTYCSDLSSDLLDDTLTSFRGYVGMSVRFGFWHFFLLRYFHTFWLLTQNFRLLSTFCLFLLFKSQLSKRSRYNDFRFISLFQKL